MLDAAELKIAREARKNFVVIYEFKYMLYCSMAVIEITSTPD